MKDSARPGPDVQRGLAATLALIFLLLGLANTASALTNLPPPRMSFLDNEEVRIGMDLSLGGAVTFLSSRAHPGNIINSADLGRQIQMSHYSGPKPFELPGKKPHSNWVQIGWNPIQSGDCYLNPSKVLEHRNDGRELYIKCRPMHWPLDNVPGECIFETWTTLDGPVIHMRFRCTNQRSDQTFYPAADQELPAVYTVSSLSRLMTYAGEQPFTGGVLTQIKNDWKAGWPWTRFTATERWAALVDTNDWGIGVFKDDGGEFHGGIYGDHPSGDPKGDSTAYVAPIHKDNFDHNITYEHRTDIMVGKLADIRRRFNALATKSPPTWKFAANRQHWFLSRATDQGFPLNGEWRIRFGDQKPWLQGPNHCWRAEQAKQVELEISYQGKPTAARVYWKRLDAESWSGDRSLSFDVTADDKPRKYRLNLAASPEYRGLITGLAFEPIANPQPGGEIALKSIKLLAAP